MHTATNILKNVITSIALVMLLASPFAPLVAQAQTAQCSATTPGATYVVDSTTGGGHYVCPNGSTTNGTTGATTPATGSGDTSGCGLTSRYDICISNIVYYIAVGLGGSLAYLGAYVFDLSVQLSLNSLAYSLDFISSGWTAVRDIANMAFLFLIIYIALVIMLQAETAGTMPLLAGIILMALLINFSFFFTRVVIDAGNILAVQFYNAIPGQTLAQSQLPGAATIIGNTVGGSTGIKDLSAGIMNAIGVQTLLSPDLFAKLAPSSGDWNQWLSNLIMLSFLYLSLGAVFWILFIMFITTGVKFIVRMVVLWLVIVASPLALVARALPQMKKFYEQWQGMLIKHALYPAFFLFIFWFLNKLLVAISCNGNGVCAQGGLIGSAAGAIAQADTSGSAIGTIAVAVGNIGIRMGIVVALMYAGLKAADFIGVMGANFAQSWSGRIGGGVLKGASGLTGFAGRRSLGLAGARASESVSLNRWADKEGRFVGGTGRTLLNLTKKVGSATYDPRNAPAGSLIKKGIEKLAGTAVPTGTAATKGFIEREKESSKKAEDARKERAGIIREASNKEAIERIAQQAAAGGTHDAADVSRARSLSKKEIESLKAAEIEKIAHVINEDKLKTVNDSDKFTDEEKAKIRALAEPVSKSQKIVSDELRKLNDNLISGASVPVIDTMTRRGSIINLTNIDTMKIALTNKLEDVKRIHDDGTTTSGTRDGLKADMTQLRNGIKSLRTLQKQVERIPAHNTLPEKEFKTY